jgi:hypothetical protein
MLMDLFEDKFHFVTASLVVQKANKHNESNSSVLLNAIRDNVLFMTCQGSITKSSAKYYKLTGFIRFFVLTLHLFNGCAQTRGEASM